MAESRQIKFSIISIWIGLLIPIVAALIPYGYKYLSPEHDLVYELVGPITVKGNKALNIKITNRGEKSEKNVRVWLKVAQPFIDFDSIIKHEKPKDPLSYITIDTSASFKAAHENDNFVISLGDIRPEETIELSISSSTLSIWGSIGVHEGLAIKSEEHLARLDGPSEFEVIAYPFGFWMFVLLMVLILLAGIYQEYLMDPKKREEWLLREIDKLSGKRENK